MTVIAPDENPVSDEAVRVQRWEGKLPFTGDYTIQLSPVKGLPSSNYKITMGLANPPTPTPTPTPTSTATPTPTTAEYQTEPINLPGGVGSVQKSGRTEPQLVRRYLVPVKRGQQLTVEVPPDVDVSVDVRYPNGTVVPDASGVKFWQAKVPRAGEYKIDVVARQPRNYTLSVSVGQ
jgi:serine/threonine-protein kinase